MTLESYHFENEYELTPNLCKELLNSCHTEISDKFKKRICRYYTKKLKLLTTCMVNEICYDGTVYAGAVGLAYHYFLVSSVQPIHDVELLNTALSYLQVDECLGNKIGFLCGDAGPLALAAVISHGLNTRAPETLPGYKIFCQRLLSLADKMKQCPDELLYGKAGYLYSLLFVNKYVGSDTIPSRHIEKVVKSIMSSGKSYSKRMKSKSPLLWQWHSKAYLGAAHGVAGILYMLLQARCYIKNKEMCKYIRPTLDWFLSQRFNSNNFPSHLCSPSDRLVQWCHGAPGVVPLCILASQCFGKPKYMRIALQCGELVWKRGLLTKGYSLCHGVSGNAYTFIQLFHATREPIHLIRAACFMDWVMCEHSGTEQVRPSRPASLFEGLLGRIHLAHEFKDLAKAEFPAMTI